MVYFGTFCNRYAGKIYPERKLAFPREYAPGDDLRRVDRAAARARSAR